VEQQTVGSGTKTGAIRRISKNGPINLCVISGDTPASYRGARDDVLMLREKIRGIETVRPVRFDTFRQGDRWGIFCIGEEDEKETLADALVVFGSFSSTLVGSILVSALAVSKIPTLLLHRDFRRPVPEALHLHRLAPELLSIQSYVEPGELVHIVVAFLRNLGKEHAIPIS